jgi:predicted Zn-dependent peptidase
MTLRIFIKSTTAALIVALIGQVQPVAAQESVPGDYKTPGGILFRHVTITGESKHALAFFWPETYATSEGAKRAVTYIGPRLILEGGEGMQPGEFVERMRDLQADGDLKGASLLVIGGLDVPKAQFADAVTTLSKTFASPALTPQRLTFLKSTGSQHIRQSLEHPALLGIRLMNQLILGASPIAEALTPSADAFLAPEIDDIIAWRKAVLTRDRVSIASAGPLSAETVGVQIDRLLVGLPEKSDEASDTAPPEMRSLNKLIVLEKNVAQSVIIAGGPTGWITNPDSIRAHLATSIMNKTDGPFMGNLRGKLGATYSVRAYPVRYHRNAFGFYLTTAVDTAKLSGALTALREEYERFIAEGVTQKELEIAKNQQLSAVEEGLRRSKAGSIMLVKSLYADQPIEHFSNYEERLRSYDVAAINDGLQTKFPSKLTYLVITPSAEGLGADCVIKSADEITKCE